MTLPDRGDEIDKTTVKGSQFQKPYLEFSFLANGIQQHPIMQVPAEREEIYQASIPTWELSKEEICREPLSKGLPGSKF